MATSVVQDADGNFYHLQAIGAKKADDTYGASMDSGPARGGFSITPADGADLAVYARGIYIGTAGDLKVDTVEGDTLTFVGAQAGGVIPVVAKRVYSTGTTAGNLVGLK